MNLMRFKYSSHNLNTVGGGRTFKFYPYFILSGKTKLFFILCISNTFSENISDFQNTSIFKQCFFYFIFENTEKKKSDIKHTINAFRIVRY